MQTLNRADIRYGQVFVKGLYGFVCQEAMVCPCFSDHPTPGLNSFHLRLVFLHEEYFTVISITKVIINNASLALIILKGALLVGLRNIGFFH